MPAKIGPLIPYYCTCSSLFTDHTCPTHGDNAIQLIEQLKSFSKDIDSGMVVSASSGEFPIPEWRPEPELKLTRKDIDTKQDDAFDKRMRNTK